MSTPTTAASSFSNEARHQLSLSVDPLAGWLKFLGRAEGAGDWFHLEVALRSYGRWLVKLAIEQQDRSALIALSTVRDRLLAATAHHRLKYTGPVETEPVVRMDDWDSYDFASHIAALHPIDCSSS